MAASKNTIKVYYQNVRGLRTKADEFSSNLALSSFDIICLTETWLCAEIHDSQYFANDYTVFRRDRDYSATGQRFGGGVLIAVSSKLKSCRRQDLETCDECVWLEILLRDRSKYLIGNYYFPPKFECSTFISHFDTLTSLINFSEYKVQIFGDFNLPGVDWALGRLDCCDYLTESKASWFLPLINFYGLSQHNNLTNASGNTLDLLLSNFPVGAIASSSHPLVRVDAYHPPFEAEFYLPCLSRELSKFIYCYEKGDYFSIYRHVESHAWSELYDSNDSDFAAQKLTSVMKEAIEEYVPKRLVKPRKFPSWFSRELKTALRKKTRFHGLYKRTCKQVWYQKFSNFRSLAKILLARDKYVHERHVENSLYSDPKSFWKHVITKPHSFSQHSSLRSSSNGDTHYVTSPKDIADEFASFFSSCYLPPIHSVKSDLINDPSDGDSLSLFSVATRDVEKAIKKLKPKSSVGTDDIPPFIIKGCCGLLAPILAHIFNVSLRTSMFPAIWKEAIVVPIHKAGDAGIVSNYRPVSLLCGFAKVFETIMQECLFSHLSKYLTLQQHGFIKGRSVETNLCTFLHYAAPVVSNRGQVDSVYFDLTKAFDKVDHALLVHKLKQYGFAPKLCEWVYSYLSSRKNFVRVDTVLSNPFFPTSGVPQGSVLGPLLFLVFINDILKCVKFAKVLLFADDIKLFSSICSEKDCDALQSDVSSILQWCSSNRLPLNINKTKVISLTRRKNPLHFKYTLGNCIITRTDMIRDLGVLVDCKLTFSSHVTTICGTGFKMLGMISRLTRHFQAPEAILRLFCALVRPRLEFASVVWNHLTETESRRIEAVQRRLVRIVYDRYFHRRLYFDHHSLLKILNLSTLDDRRHCRDAAFLQKLIQGVIDVPDLLDSIKLRVPTKFTRQCDMFYPDMRLKESPIYRIQTSCNLLVQHDFFFMPYFTFNT